MSHSVSGFRGLGPEELKQVMCLSGGRGARGVCFFHMRRDCAVYAASVCVLRSLRPRAVARAGFGELRLRRQLVDRQRWETRFVVLVLSPLFNRDLCARCSMNCYS